MSAAHQKVTASHLSRDAYLYVRQSSLRQVFNHGESTRRQYNLRERAVALGWSIESVVVIDSDLGLSGADGDREGFQRLVAEVGMGRAGIVLGLEVSRLARNSTDWHRLLEICALSETLILDEDGVYDPGDFNDRLLLGLKGTMSEAELHMMRARLRGGTLSAARRGELRVSLPVGLVYDPLGNVMLDPDLQVQHSLRLLFDTFTRTGSANATVRHFNQENLLFPHRPKGGPHKGELHWKPLRYARALRALHNPRYAGAYAFGRNRSQRRPGGGTETRRLPREEWTVLLRDVHPGYITWERFEQNERKIRENDMAHAPGAGRRSPPREGPALLQGLAICGVCGRTMAVRYHKQKEGLHPYYLCSHEGQQTSSRWCQNIPGAAIDRVIGELLVELMTPLTLDVALQVQDEMSARAEEVDRWHAQQVQRAREEADLARHRFMQTHPDHQLVANTLEADWNEKLRALNDAQQELERRRADPAPGLDDEQRERILALASDFPRLWNDPATPHRERKRMARLLIEDVTVTKATRSLGVRLRGGATRQITWTPEPHISEVYKTSDEVVAEIDRLLDDHTSSKVAELLNERGHRSGHGLAFTARLVDVIRNRYALKPHYQRLRDRGFLQVDEVARQLGVSHRTVYRWRKAGLLRRHVYCDAGYCLLEIPDPPPEKRGNGSPGDNWRISRGMIKTVKV
ncbi:MAG: recombinase family protein [Gammaproteobacteria bacterium]|nr:recombinase family protein [Gammaproteobacteria bacterium]MDE2654120.1 recombinase family protein [Gemmatimonadota bacterium]